MFDDVLYRSICYRLNAKLLQIVCFLDVLKRVRVLTNANVKYNIYCCVPFLLSSRTLINKQNRVWNLHLLAITLSVALSRCISPVTQFILQQSS